VTGSDPITYAREDAVSAEEFEAVLAASGLGTIRPVGDRDRLQRMLDNANIVMTARTADGRMVGIARAVTDFSWVCYLSDLAVMPDAKGLGVGRGLLAAMREALGPEVSLILVSVPDAVGFYEAVDMEALPHCFWHKRTC
jgi:ribosomal protein S18 acetylase RimI-like enzyme